MGDMANWVIENGMMSELEGEFDDEDGCEFCGEPGKLRVIDGTPNNLCDECYECYTDEMCG